MKIMLTGASGFLGRSIKRTLSAHEIVTIGRSGADIIADLTNDVPALPFCNIVVHAAGKAHLNPKNDTERRMFFDVNVKGTQNLLAALQNSNKPESFVFISSVAVYGLKHALLAAEELPLLADDAYGRSKIEAEELAADWCLKNNVLCTVLRLPLIAGPNPPGNLGSMIRGIKAGYYFDIAGGKAKKSMVLAEDVAKIIPAAAKSGGIYNLTDGYHPSFSEISAAIAGQSGRVKPPNIPYWLAVAMARTGDLLGSRSPFNSEKLEKITSDLTFDDSKARRVLGWHPAPVLNALSGSISPFNEKS